MNAGRALVYVQFDTPGTRANLPVLDNPDECPMCHRSVTPTALYGAASSHDSPTLMEVVYRCPSGFCGLLFIGRFRWDSRRGFGVLYECVPVQAKQLSFPDEIRSLSDGYCKVFEQAAEAEQRGISDVAGAGYRKALEFLVTDYALKYNPGEEKEILELRLVARISKYVKHPEAALCAQRARLLRNDETHYKRTEGADLDEPKTTLSLTETWIALQLKTEALRAKTAEALPGDAKKDPK